jgi:hypothetical protein
MSQPYTAPSLKAKAFNCPHCNAYSNQTWVMLANLIPQNNPYWIWGNSLDISLCAHCNTASLWVKNTLVWPTAILAPIAGADMPADIKNDFDEARSVLAVSPRSSAALLRLCVQKLCIELGEPGKNINEDIGRLVAKGLSPKVQKALDVVRVVGNEQVHPGTLDVRDNPEIAAKLFALVNFIVDDQISKPKLIDELYQKIPDDKLKGIKDRDKPKV